MTNVACLVLFPLADDFPFVPLQLVHLAKTNLVVLVGMGLSLLMQHLVLLL